MAPVRLYVGGLPPDIDEEQLRARFTPFGTVSACSIAPPKVYGSASFPRNFGHVELEPKDEAALRRCISAYNGCSWKGAVLKCALARPHHLERLREAEQEAEAQEKEAAADDLRPPLGPGSVLRLRPPKTPAVVEVALGSGAKLVQFPEPEPSQQQQQGREASWEPLQAPPRSGYRFEAHLQRIAANLPPELVAAVEARRERGRRLAEARERAREEAAGMEVAYQYSEDSGGSGSLELGSDDDAATAAATVAAAMAARERRMAAAAGAQPAATSRPKAAAAAAAAGVQQQDRRQQQRGQRLSVVDFAASEAHLAPGKGASAAADLSRFDSDADSDADLAAPAPGRVGQARPALPAKPMQPKPLPASQQQQQQKEQQLKQLAETPPLEPAASSGSSGSSGGSELEEWLAAEGAGGASNGPGLASGEGVGLGSRPAFGNGHADSRLGPSSENGPAATGYASEEDEEGTVSSGSSGGSELEEWLAVEGEVRGSDGGVEEEAEGAAAAEGDEEEAEDGSDGNTGLHAAAGREQQSQQQQRAQLQQQQQQQQPPGQRVQQQRAVVDFLEEATNLSGRQWWQGPSGTLDTDLSRFASSDEDEGARLPARAAPASTGGRRRQGPAGAPQPGKSAKRARLIPQVDGAADSDDDSSSSGGSGNSSGEESTASEGSGDAPSSSDSKPSSGSSGSEEEEEEAGAGSSSSSSSEESSEGGSSSEEDKAPQQGAKSALKTAAHGASGSEEEEEEEQDAAAAAAAHEAAARRAEEVEQQRRLAALFPEGAAFVRIEPLAQIEAAWRVNRDAWVQDFRQKHRQAVRLMGRAASGGGGKRQRKG